MVGGKREERSYRLQREAVAVAPPPPPVAQPAPKPVEAKPAPAAPSVAMATPPPAPGRPGRRRISRRRRSPRRPPPPAASGDHSNLRPVAWGVGIAGIAGLVFGAVEGVIAINKRNEFNDHTGPDPTNPLGGDDPGLQHDLAHARLPGHPGIARERAEAVDHRFRRGRRADGGRGGAVGAVVTQGARERLRHRLSPAPLISGRVVLPVGCSSPRRSLNAA